MMEPTLGSVDNTEHSPGKQWQSVLHFAMQMCRKHGFIRDRFTLVSPSDFLQIVQLCQAQVQKRKGRGFEADDSSRIFPLARTVYSRKQDRAVAEVLTVLPSSTCLTHTGGASSDTSTHTPACTQQQGTPPAIGATTPRCNSKASHRTDIGDSDQPPDCGEQNVVDVTPSRGSGQGQAGEVDAAELDSLTTEVLQEYDRFLSHSNHVDAIDVLRTFLLQLVKPDCDLLTADWLSLPQLECADHPLDPLQDLIVKQLTSKRANNGNEGSNPLQTPSKCPMAPGREDQARVKGTALWPDTAPQGRGTESDSQLKSTDQITEADMLEEVIGELTHCYLHLLVNSRSELALARVFNSPDRGLTHQAFTCLKHLATVKNMSLYQTAMSVLMKLRLGGRGYAPDPSHQLLQHVKGLTMLSDLMDTLQQVLEDTHCVRSSVLRVVGVVRKHLIGCQSGRFRRERVEGVSGGIQRDLGAVVDGLQGEGRLVSPDKPACQGGSLTSRHPRRVLLLYLDQRALTLWVASPHLLPLPPHHPSLHLHTWLHDVPFGPNTPSRFPCVLSQYRSPAADSVASPVSGKGNKIGTPQRKRKMTVSTNLMPDSQDQTLLQRCSKRLSDTVIVLPSMTIMHPAAVSRPTATTTTTTTTTSSKDRSFPGDKENHQPSLHNPGNNSSNNNNKKKRKKGAEKGAGGSNSHPPSPSAHAPLGLGVAQGSGQKKKTTAMPGKGEQQQTGRRAAPSKASGKKCRRRLLSPPKGQRSITSFFCV